MTSPIRAFVTGSSGFVGRHLLPELERRKVDVTTVRRELGADTDWQDVLGGVDTVIHLAAAAHERAQAYERARNYEALRRINALGTERLARDAAQAGVRHFVFLSTIGVFGEETLGTPFTEQTRPAPRSLYAASKLEAEQLLGQVARATQLRVTVLRPTLVYGPGNAGNFLRLLKLVDRGFPLPFAAVRNRRSLTYVDNLVSAIAAVVAWQGASETFLVSDAVAVSTADLIRSLAGGMEREALLFAFPPALLTLAGRLAGRQDQVRRLIGSLEVDSSKLAAALGWRPPFDPAEGLRETAAWYRAEYRGRRGD